MTVPQTDTPTDLISALQIREAYAQIAPLVRHTPVTSAGQIAARVGRKPSQLVLKLENLQRTGSFKIRGALRRVLTLTDAQKARGVVTASAGNHAQGVALAARDAGVPATVFMARFASIAKIQATENYGATVVLEGDSYDEAVDAARTFAARTGATLIPAFDDDAVITGQGSVGLELVDDVPDLDTVVIPIGGGGLFAGVSTMVRASRPGCRIIGVQAEGANTAAVSFARKALVPRTEPVMTIADGIAVKSPSPRTWAYLERYADEIVTVSDARIAEAILLLLTRAKVVVEGAGAAGLAALLEYPVLARGKTALILCGGNIDAKLLADLIERGMIRSHRYFHFLTSLPDRPGMLARVADTVAQSGANIVEVTHDRISPGVAYGHTGLRLLVEVRDEAHIERLTVLLAEQGLPVHPLSPSSSSPGTGGGYTPYNEARAANQQ